MGQRAFAFAPEHSPREQQRRHRHFRARLVRGRWTIEGLIDDAWTGALAGLDRSDVVAAFTKLQNQGCVIENSPDLNWTTKGRK
jgi:hypothetical protein